MHAACFDIFQATLDGSANKQMVLNIVQCAIVGKRVDQIDRSLLGWRHWQASAKESLF
jgi:hypothetical protein